MNREPLTTQTRDGVTQVLVPNFSVLSRYNEESGIEIVRFGANANVLESELNESQQLANKRLCDVMRLAYTEGVSNTDKLTYAGGVFSMNDVWAHIDGHLIYVSALSMDAPNGTKIYLDTWVEEENYLSILKKYGNVQEEEIANWFLDTTIGGETAEREVRKYNLSNANLTAQHQYLYLGQIASGAFSRVVTKIASRLDSNMRYEEEFVSALNQTVFLLQQGKYTPNKGQVMVFLNGIKLSHEAFVETSETKITLRKGLPAGMEVTIIYG